MKAYDKRTARDDAITFFKRCCAWLTIEDAMFEQECKPPTAVPSS